MLGSYFKNERGEKQSNSQLRCEQPGRANGACVSVCVYIFMYPWRSLPRGFFHYRMYKHSKTCLSVEICTLRTLRLTVI